MSQSPVEGTRKNLGVAKSLFDGSTVEDNHNCIGAVTLAIDVENDSHTVDPAQAPSKENCKNPSINKSMLDRSDANDYHDDLDAVTLPIGVANDSDPAKP
jgi:hypothetical protein